MKKYIITGFRALIMRVALVSANTMSQLGMFQPECPEELKRFKNKNKYDKM